MLIWFSILLFVILGILDFFLFKRHVSMQPTKNHKIIYYAQCLLEIWIPTLILIGLFITGQVNFHEIGLGWYKLENSGFSKWLSISVLVLSLLTIIYLIVDLVRYQTNSQYKELVDNKIRQAKIPAYYDYLRPRTAVEKRLFGFLSLSAGVLEEVLYRGYLISLLGDGLNNTWIAVVAAALLFGIGHLYQGLGGILKTFIIGILMGIIFVGTGSIINCILLHILIDISSSFYSYDEQIESHNNPSLART